MIDIATHPLLLFAARTYWRRFNDNFDGNYWDANTGEAVTVLVVMVVLVTAMLLVNYLTSLTSGRLPSNSPSGLFRELSRAHGLSRPRKRLLKKLATVRGLTSPEMVFVEPDCFAIAGLPDELREQAHELTWLAQHLFGDEVDERSSLHDRA